MSIIFLACIMFSLLIFFVNFFGLKSRTTQSAIYGLFVLISLFILNFVVAGKEQVYKQKIKSMEVLVETVQKRLDGTQKIYNVFIKKEQEKIEERLAEVQQRHVREIEQIQEKAAAAGLGGWREEVVVPAQIKKVFRFKGEVKGVRELAEVDKNTK